MEQRDRILHRLSMKGLAETDELAAELDADVADVQSELETLQAEGIVETEGFWYITDEGEVHLDASLRDRFTESQIEQLEANIDEFSVMDEELKELASEWQAPDGDLSTAELLDQLGALQQSVESFFRDHDERVYSEYRAYLDDLETALEEIEAGNEEYFTGAEVSSYHTVWFRLHDDLLRTLGIERDD